jgi:hypothetical protein
VNTPQQIIDLMEEVARQDRLHREGYPADRNGLRLALAAIEDELDEAKMAHRAERRVAGWHETREEILQIAAVALRAVRSIDEASQT